MGWLARLLLCIAVGAAAGCSVPRLVYNHADWLLLDRIDDYVELDVQQRSELSRALARRLEDHRRQELPAIADALDRTAAMLRSGLDGAGARWLAETTPALARQSVALIVEDIARTLTRLDDTQRRGLRERLARHTARRFAERGVDDTEQVRLARRSERSIEFLEEFLGPMKSWQVELVTDSLRRMPDSLGLWREYTEQRYGVLFAQLERGDSADAIALNLRRGFIDYLDLPPQLRTMREKKITLTAQMLLDLERSLTPAQRERAVHRLEDLRDDARALIARAR